MRNAWLARVVSIAVIRRAGGQRRGRRKTMGSRWRTDFPRWWCTKGQGMGRHLAVAANGDIYVAGRNGSRRCATPIATASPTSSPLSAT